MTRARFKRKPLVLGIGFQQCGVIDEATQIVEMRLRHFFFVRRDMTPLAYELLRRNSCWHWL